MANTRKRLFNTEEDLAFIQGDMDLNIVGMISLNESVNEYSSTLADIDMNIIELDHIFEREVLESVADKIDCDIQFDINQAIEEEIEEISCPVSMKRRKSSPEEWKQNIAKSKRSLGQPYRDKKMIDGVWTSVERPKRKMGALCTKENCKNSKSRHCNEFLEEDCREIFEEFWKTGDKGIQDTFIRSHVDVTKTKDAKKSKENSRREFSRIKKRERECGN